MPKRRTWIAGWFMVGGWLCSLLGCAAVTPACPVTEDFRCRAEVTCDGTTYSGVVIRRGAGTLTWTMEEPASVKGLSLSWNGQNFTAALQGMTYTLNGDGLPSAAPAAILRTALDTVTRQGDQTPMVSSEDGTARVTGTCSAGTFVLMSEAASGCLRELSLPDSEVHIRFSAFETGSFTLSEASSEAE